MKKLFAVIAIVMILGLVFGATQVYASSGNASGLEQPILKKTPPGLEKQNPGVDKKATQQTEKDLRTAERQLEKEKQNGKKLSFRGTVKEVLPDGFVLTVGAADITFMVDQKTQIKIPTLGKDAPLTELHVGVQASVRAVELVSEEVVPAEGETPPEQVAPAASYLALSVQVIPGKPVRIHRVGVVIFYEAGVSITIQAKDMMQYTFLLDANTKILPADRVDQLVPGVFVTIISRRDVTGGPLAAQGIVIHPKVDEEVTPITDVTLSNSTVEENKPVDTVVGTLSATSSDAAAEFVYSLMPGVLDNDSFKIVGNVLQTAAVFDFETKASYTIRVRVVDQNGMFFEKVFTITVTDTETEPPTDISLTPSSVPDGTLMNAVVGAFTTTDPNVGDTFTYTLVPGTGDTDNASFKVDGANLVTLVDIVFATKSSYSIRVRSTDQTGLFFEKEFTITVTPVTP